MEVRIVCLEPIGDHKRGDVIVENVYKARKYVDDKKAVYYADFTESMLEEASDEEAPSSKKKATKKD